MSVCRNCNATIRWVKLETGRPIPVEPHPSVDKGSIAAMKVSDGQLAGYVITAARPFQDGYSRYITHFALCQPNVTPRVPLPRPPSLFDPGSA